MSVDEYMENKVLPEYRPIVALIRGLMGKIAPDAQELIYYGQPMYKQNNRAFMWITPSRSGVSVGFLGGTAFEDKYGLLRGKGKSSRNIKIKSLKEADKEVLAYYIKQAIALTNEKKP